MRLTHCFAGNAEASLMQACMASGWSFSAPVLVTLDRSLRQLIGQTQPLLPTLAAEAAGKALEAPPVGNCDATQVQSLVGQAYTDKIGSQAQQDASAKQLRVLKPNDMTTMEFVGERLNVEVDEKDVVSGLRCG